MTFLKWNFKIEHFCLKRPLFMCHFPRCRPHSFVFRLHITLLCPVQLPRLDHMNNTRTHTLCRVDSVNQQVSAAVSSMPIGRDAGDLCGRLYFDDGCLQMNAALRSAAYRRVQAERVGFERRSDSVVLLI